MRRKSSGKPGFTLVEIIVVIVMMSILAAAGLVGFGAMVSHFRQQQCIASRREAAQEFISEWMEGDIPDPESYDWNAWLAAYRAGNQTEHSDKWSIKVAKADGRYQITVSCSAHPPGPLEELVMLEFGPPVLKE